MSGLISTSKTTSGVGGAVAYISSRFVIANAYNTAIGHGDPVCIDTVTGTLIKCPETRVPDGILRGIMFYNSSGQFQLLDWFPAGTSNTGIIDGTTAVVAMVEPVSDRIFRIQATGTVAQTDIGRIRRLSDNSVNTNTGRAGTTVNMAGAVTTEVRLVRIRDIDRRPGSAFGTNPFVLVEIIDPDATSLA